MFGFVIGFQCNFQGIYLRFCTINPLSTNGSDLLQLLVQSFFAIYYPFSLLASFPNYQFVGMGMYYCSLDPPTSSTQLFSSSLQYAGGSAEKSESLINVCVCVRAHLLFQVKSILLHPEPFSTENGLLTPTLKAKRGELFKYFRTQINSLYENIQEQVKVLRSWRGLRGSLPCRNMD